MRTYKRKFEYRYGQYTRVIPLRETLRVLWLALKLVWYRWILRREDIDYIHRHDPILNPYVNVMKYGFPLDTVYKLSQQVCDI